MTYQIRDTFILNGKTYLIGHITTTGKNWFSPYQYGFSPYYTCTACWSGYQCCYAINEGKLNLVTLNINNKNDMYPPFMGVKANTFKHHKLFKATYNNIFLDFKFTGNIVITKDYLFEKYREYNEYPEIWQYEKVVELYFRRGKLIKLTDISNKMKFRQQREEVWRDLSKDKRVQQILRLCCQWIEENKHNIYCNIKEQSLKENTQAYLAKENLLSNLTERLPGRKSLKSKKYIKNTFINDQLYQEISTLCEKWMLANLDMYDGRKVHRHTNQLKGIKITRRNTKTYRLTMLRIHLTAFYGVNNNITDSLGKIYPYPKNSYTNPKQRNTKKYRGLFSLLN